MNDAAGDFSDFGGAAYLNCAYQGPLPNVAVQAAKEALEREQNPHHFRDADYFDVPDRYREAIARLIGCRPSDVAVTNSTTDGTMILVNGLDWREGDEVILPAGEFPANRFPWLSLERRGVTVREVELPRDADGLDRLESAIRPRTRVISANWVSYRSGHRRDLHELSELCRARGILLVVDGSQGIGGLPFDLSTLACDVVACSGYKWLLGPYGTGFAWVRPELGERLTPGNINWFSVEGARNFNRLSECRLEFVPGAARFDVNETASFVSVETATAALGYLEGVGVERVAGHVRGLLDRLIAGLPRGFHASGDLRPEHRSNIVCIAGDGPQATQDAYARLVERQIVVSLRENAIRISPHIYNTVEQIDSLLNVLDGA